MQPAAIKERSPTLAHGQQAALISLLVDDDPAIYQMVRSRILSYGRAALPWIQPHALSNEPVMRRRIKEIIRHLRRQESDERFLGFCQGHGEDIDLEEATGLLAQTEFPEINRVGYQAMYDSWAAELRGRFCHVGSAEQVLAPLHQHLFGELGFSGNEEYLYQPESCYLNKVIDRRSGNPISLCTIYLFLARRLQLPIVGIGLPNHFLCRYQSPTEEVFIDVFRQGKLMTKGDCIKYLHHTTHNLREGYMAPVSTRRMLLRMCANLHQTYAHLEMSEEAGRVQRYLVALTK